MNVDQLEFSTFCIGNVAEALKISELDAYVMLLTSGLLKDYIVKYYDVLHTYSRRYITEDLTLLLHEKEDAMDFFYHSQTFTLISKGISDMHAMSDKYLAEEICMEMDGKKL